MSYHPIHDKWFLARPKRRNGAAFYGAYPNGFLWRARILIGAWPSDAVLHVCAGVVRHRTMDRIGPNDRTLDLDRALEPDFLQDAREPYPTGFRAILADPPYSPADAEQYTPGRAAYPEAESILRHALDALPPGGRAGILHVRAPRPPTKGVRFAATVAVLVSYGNQVREFSVFEKLG